MYGQASADGHHSNPTGWKRWAYSTNHKDIGTMYLIFAIIAGIIGSLFSVVMRIKNEFSNNKKNKLFTVNMILPLALKELSR